MTSVKAIVVALLLAFIAVVAPAQKIRPTDGEKVRVPKVALWPSIFTEEDEACDNKTAIRTCSEALDEIFQNLGFEKEDQGKVNGVINQLGLRSGTKELATPEDMLRLGKELKVDYVVATKWHWHIKTILAAGLKTKACCTFETLIINVAKEEIDFRPEPYKCDSEKRLSNEEVAGFLLVSILVPVISGGPKTPHMERSGKIGCVVALKPWLDKQQPAQDKKIKLGK